MTGWREFWVARRAMRLPSTRADPWQPGAENYERLEFLGDRVLGLIMAEWLWEQFPAEPEGQLSRRLNSLVTGAVCADVARDLGVREHLRLGKQARDDGASDSDNVLGDVMEALIAPGIARPGWKRRAPLSARPGATGFIRRQGPAASQVALQEWAAAHNRKAPEYVVVDRSVRIMRRASRGGADRPHGEVTATGPTSRKLRRRPRRRCWRN